MVCPTRPRKLFTLFNPPSLPKRLIRLGYKGIKVLRRLNTGNKVFSCQNPEGSNGYRKNLNREDATSVGVKSFADKKQIAAI
jgi:hypothetical protein